MGSVDARLFFFVLGICDLEVLVRIKLVLGGREYSADVADLASLSIGEIRAINEHLGLTPSGLRTNLMNFANLIKSAKDGGEFDEMAAVDVFSALVYLVMARSGEKVTWADVDAIPIVALATGFSVVNDGPLPSRATAPDLVLTDRGA